ARARPELEGHGWLAVERPPGPGGRIRVGDGMGEEERKQRRALPGRERHREGRAGLRQPEREGEPPREALHRLLVLLQGADAVHRAQSVPRDEGGLRAPGPRDQLAARRGHEAPEPAREPELEPAGALAENAGKLVVPVEAVRVVDVVQPELVEVLALAAEVVHELVRRVLAVVAVV